MSMLSGHRAILESLSGSIALPVTIRRREQAKFYGHQRAMLVWYAGIVRDRAFRGAEWTWKQLGRSLDKGKSGTSPNDFHLNIHMYSQFSHIWRMIHELTKRDVFRCVQ